MSIESLGQFNKKEIPKNKEKTDMETAEKAIEEIEITLESLSGENRDKITQQLERLSKIRQKASEARKIAESAKQRRQEKKDFNKTYLHF